MIIDFGDLVGSSSVSCAIKIDGFAQLRMMGARPMMMPGCCGGCPGAMPPNSSGEGEGGNPAGASQGTTSSAFGAEIAISKFHLTAFRITTLNHAFSYSFKGFIDMGLQYVLACAGKLTFHSRLISIEDHRITLHLLALLLSRACQ